MLLANRFAHLHDGEDASIVNLLDSKLLAPDPIFSATPFRKRFLPPSPTSLPEPLLPGAFARMPWLPA